MCYGDVRKCSSLSSQIEFEGLKLPDTLTADIGPSSKEDIFKALINHQTSLAGRYNELTAEKGRCEGFYLPINLPLILHEVVFGRECPDVFRNTILARMKNVGMENVPCRAR